MRYNHFDMLPNAAFKPIGKSMALYGKGSAPATPDYAGAATATAAGNLDAARAASAANKVNQVTPYGNLTYTIDGKDSFGNDRYTQTETLSAAEQNKLDQNNALSNSLLGTAQKGLNGVDQMLTNGFDFNALPKSAVDAGQTGQDAIMARLNPQFAQSEEALRTRLVNQGVRAGSQAWDHEFANFNQGKNDAYSQAALQGIGVGQQARQQALQEQEFGRTEGLNMVNALRTGNQVQNPTFTPVPQQATTQGADLLGAAGLTGQYNTSVNNAQNASSAGLFGGLGQIGGALAGASAKPWWLGA